MRPATRPEVQVRHCHGLAEFQLCVEIQKRVWAGPDMTVPLAMFVVAAETGGQVLGVFLGEQMVGFTMAVAGLRDAKPFLHSHMTAVLEEYRDRGVGRQLKLFQRQDALNREIELVEWTFDPLELKNAYFNLVLLGAIARRYLPNCYGLTSSPLHGGLPTDRLMAEWWLRSPRVEAALAGRQRARPASPVAGGSRELTAGRESASGAQGVRVHVPGNVAEMKQNDPSAAARVQGEVRERFQQEFARGYAATGFEATEVGGDYLLAPWSSN